MFDTGVGRGNSFIDDLYAPTVVPVVEALAAVGLDEREGVRIIPTPGHTPGHQSLIVDTGAGRIVIAGQCVYKLEEARHRHVALDNMHDSTYEAIGQDSLDRLLSFRPCTLVASHDPTSCAI